MKIWILTQIANDYNQPENDLVAWWPEKPSEEQLEAVLGCANFRKYRTAVKELLEYGRYREDYGTTCFLREVGPGPLDVRR